MRGNAPTGAHLALVAPMTDEATRTRLPARSARRSCRGPPSPRKALSDSIVDEILDGLTADAEAAIAEILLRRKRGSELFDQICDLPEYYPTRTELAVMRDAPRRGRRARRAARCRDRVRRRLEHRRCALLLDHLIDPAAYVPVDISADYLEQQADELAEDYPDVDVQPVLRGLHAAVRSAGASRGAASAISSSSRARRSATSRARRRSSCSSDGRRGEARRRGS